MWGTPRPVGDGPWPEVPPRPEAFFADVVDVVRPSSVIEFGSWEGASAIAWAIAARSLGLATHVYCVDTWLGSAEHWANDFPDGQWSRDRLRVEQGEPQFIDTFRNTVTVHDLNDRISPLRATTEGGTTFLSAYEIGADVVYVDADHAYRAVFHDLVRAESLLAPGGIITGDDWGWASVRIAVLQFSLRRGYQVAVSAEGTKYLLVSRRSRVQVGDFTRRGFTVASPAAEAGSFTERRIRRVASRMRGRSGGRG